MVYVCDVRVALYMGELFRKSMLTERIMHTCIMKLLGETKNPDEVGGLGWHLMQLPHMSSTAAATHVINRVLDPCFFR